MFQLVSTWRRQLLYSRKPSICWGFRWHSSHVSGGLKPDRPTHGGNTRNFKRTRGKFRFRYGYLEVIGDKLTILFPDFVREKFESKSLRSTFRGATIKFWNGNGNILRCLVVECNLTSQRKINQCNEIVGSELNYSSPLRLGYKNDWSILPVHLILYAGQSPSEGSE